MAALAACGWQAAHVLPFTRLWPVEVAEVDGAVADGSLRLVIANVRYDNHEHDAVRRTLEALEADLLLLVEIDSAWNEALSPLSRRYPHRVEELRPRGLGMALWSRLELRDPEVRELVSERRPSIWADVATRGGVVRLVGVHPAPPGLRRRESDTRQDSRPRDAELVLVARAVAQDRDSQWVVAGDFNDVAWSSTTELFRSLSGLVDPRVGRTLLNTYHADLPLLRYPLDHVFVSRGFAVGEFRRVMLPGSDHFAVVIELAPRSDLGVEPEASPEEHERAAELVREGEEEVQREGGGG